MTCIVWDGKTLAADKRASGGDSHYPITKIFKHENILLGFAGDVSKGFAMKQWAINGFKLDEFPAFQSSEDFVEFIVIERQKRGKPIVMMYEQTPFPHIVERGFHAIGSGGHFAIAALHLGRTAKESVEIASIYSTECGNGIDTLSFINLN